MTSQADSQPVVAETPSAVSTSATDRNWLQGLGAELAFVQDVSGIYCAFEWRNGEAYGIFSTELEGRKIGEVFGPVALAPYLDRVQRVLDSLIPERFSYPFAYQDHYFLFDLAVSPILTASSEVSRVLVMGRLLTHEPKPKHSNRPGEGVRGRGPLDLHQKMLRNIVGSIRRTLPPSSELYQKLLSKIARNIRRTLNLSTICDKLVNGLGEVLLVSRCVILLYSETGSGMRVVAEFRQDGVASILGTEVPVLADSGLSQAMLTLQPVAVCHCRDTLFGETSVLAVAACYQDRPRGLICLHQCDRPRAWTPAEIEFVQELADQAGTAIAHATLYQELEAARVQAEEASRLKSEFLANTSHELRTPLNGMIGFLKLIMDGMADDPEEQEEFIHEAYRSALHLLNLINDVLDIAKIEAGKMQIEMGPVKLDDLLSAVEDLTKAQVQQKNLYFQVIRPATYDEVLLFGNYQRLLQVLLNLVGNGIKFTHEGGVTVTADVIRQKMTVHNQDFPGIVRFRVSDTGIGVALDKQQRLFQSFCQVDSSRTRQYGGTGLGLTISQKLVEAMGGVVNFYSLGEGLGATVTFTAALYQEPVMISGLENGEINDDQF